MKDGWQRKQIGDLCEVVAGQSPEGKFYNTDANGLPFYQGKKGFGVKFIEAPTTWTTQTTKTAREGDILMSVRAPVGPVNLATGKICIGRGLAAIRSRTELDRDFLYYQLVHLQTEIAGREGAVFPSINKSEIEALPIVYAPLREQKRVVAILDEAFAAIATARANTEESLRNAEELVESATDSLFLNTPEPDVGARTLEDLCDLIVDCEHRTAPTQDHGIPSIRTPNIGRGRLILDDVYRVSEETYREWTRRAEPKGGDLILAREAPAGNVAVIPDGLRVCLGQRTVLIRPDRSAFEPDYLAHLLLQRDSQQRLLAHSRGATVAHVNVQDIRAFTLSAVPALDRQGAVVEKIRSLLEHGDLLVAALRRKTSALEELKQALLQQAFAGAL